jgi:peptide/nickel transport system substrate-binding protein/oligopeptide transport system substrate-binding protein
MLRRHRVFFVFLALALTLATFVSAPLTNAQGDNKDVYGRALPEDAAPYDQQIWTELCEASRKETTLASAISVYSRICDQHGFDHFGDALVNLDENLNLIPGAAESWSASADGLTWTFKLRPGQVWSDGTPLTATDYLETYRFMVDPKNAYDFVWMWQGVIKGWSQAVAGEIKPEEIGMAAVDDLTLTVTTEAPFPPLPGTLYFWSPLQAKALKEIGPSYILDPKTSVSSGPFMLKEFVPGDRLILVANPTYTGFRKPYLKEIHGRYGDSRNGSFAAFQAYQIEHVSYDNLSSADFKLINDTPQLRDNYKANQGDFRTDYLLMDTFNPPFNDVRVRQAFAKALDRESIVSSVIGAQFAIPAYSFLMPGFPAADVEGALKPLQNYECEAAKKLLADAGFPDGAGFPELELKLRGESQSNQQRFIAAAASISQCLNVKITVNNLEFNDYMTKLLKRPTEVQFGAVSYGMDYLDPANMLGVWVSTGRHSWRNEKFDELVTTANSLVGDPAKRLQMYKDAERILVEDVGGIFLNHRIQGNLFQPYVKGDCFRPNAQGNSARHWGNDWCWGSFYLSKDVANFRK